MFLAKALAQLFYQTKNFGYEYSLNVGHSYAPKNQYKIMITFDADGQLPYTSIPYIHKVNSKRCRHCYWEEN